MQVYMHIYSQIYVQVAYNFDTFYATNWNLVWYLPMPRP